MKLKKIFSLFISITLTSCSLPLNNNVNNKADGNSRLSGYSKELKTEKLSFKTKGITTYQEDSVTTSNSWQIVNNENASGGAYKFYNGRATTVVDNNEGSTYLGNWLSINDINAYGGSYRMTDQKPIQNYEENVLSYTGSWVNNTTSGVTTKGASNVPDGINILNNNSNILYSSGWTTLNDNTFTNSVPINISHRSTSPVNNLVYKYNNNTQSQSWSDSMLGGWVNHYWNGSSTSVSTSTQSRSVEFTFTGTNVRILQRKGPTMGICNLKIFNSSNQEVKNLQIDNYSPTLIVGSYTDVFGLKNDTYKVVLQGPFIKNPNSTGWTFHFDGARVYPSIEYTFTGDNISYMPYVSNNSGQVRVSINGENPEIIDLYNPTTIKITRKQYFNLPYGNHRITIEATDTRNPLSTGNQVSLSQFRMFQSVSGTFTGDNLIISGLRRNVYGQADLYIDGNLIDADPNKAGINPIDFYSESTTPKQEIVAVVKGLSSGNHRFSILGRGQKNPASTSRVFYIDFVGTGFPYFERNFEGYDQSIYGLRGPDYGMVNIYVNGTQVDGNTDTPEMDPIDLYRANYNLNELITYRYFFNLAPRTIKVEQTFIKNPLSNGYKFSSDYFGTGGVLSESGYIAFAGTSISLRVRKGPDMGIMLVGIDGSAAGKLDLYSPTESFEDVLFSDLSNNSHYLTMQPDSSKNILSTGYAISIDSYNVDNPLQPEITSFSPSSAGIGEWITIEGENFNLDPSRNQVKINGLLLRIIDLIDVNTENEFAEKIIAEIPPGLTGDGFIQITNTQLNITGSSTTKLVYSNKPVALFNVNPESSNTTSTLFEFDANNSYDIEDNKNLLYKWDFGDGTIIDFTSNKFVTHTFSTAGYKTVRMTVKDQNGKESYTDKTIYIGSLQTGWTELTSIPNYTYLSGASIINGKIYITGGNDGTGASRRVYQYDITTNTWWNPTDTDSDPCNGPNVRCIPSLVQAVPSFTYNGKIVLFMDRLYKMDTPDLPDFIGSWTDYGNESKYPSSTNTSLGSAMAIINNKLYIAGGIDLAFNPIKKFISFDLITRTWDTTSLPDLPENFAFGSFGVVNNKIYVIGGRDSDSTASNKVRIFDTNNPSAGWTYGADLDIGTIDSAYAVLNDKIYLMGGRTINGINNKVKIYNTSTNTWSNGVDIPLFTNYIGYANSAATVVGNQIFFISGVRNNSNASSNKVFRYIPN